MPGNQIGSGAGVVGTQQQFSNTTPVKGGQYVVVGPPIPANQMPAQFTIYDPATGGQPTSNKNIISGGSFATQPQLNTTTTNPNPNSIIPRMNNLEVERPGNMSIWRPRPDGSKLPV